MIFGAILGFVAGALVGSVFMIADLLRNLMPRKIAAGDTGSHDNPTNDG